MSEPELQELLDEIVHASAGTLDGLRPGLDAGEVGEALVEVATSSNRSVSWVAANGPRVDVSVVARDREWRIVLELAGQRVTSAVVFERPQRFAGVEGGRAVIVNGPSSVGKSTLMAAVLRLSSTPWVMFDELFFGAVAMPFLIWGDLAPTLRPGFLAGIEALAAAGNQVIMTGGSPDEFEHLRGHVPTIVVGLDCPLDVRIERQGERLDRWGGLTQETEDRHRGWAYDLRFDTRSLSPDEIAARILARVETA